MTQDMNFMNARADDEEIPAWKRLDIALRKMAVLTQFEKDQEKYAKLQAEYK
jgi:hypothetical protein